MGDCGGGVDGGGVGDDNGCEDCGAGGYDDKNGRTKQNMPRFYQFYEDFKVNKERLNIQKATENLTIPHLIIHGNNDSSVLINEAENLKKWNPKSEYHIIENANHVFNTSHPWEDNFLSEELLKGIALSVNFLNQ